MWIKNIEDKIELNAFQKKESLKELFQSINPYFFTFNYTKTLQVLYGIKKVTHIHNRSGQKLIFGHCERDVMYGENSKNEESLNEPMISSSFLDDMVTSFRKDTDTQLKKYKSDFKKLDCSIDCVYSYGFSYAKVDSVYIKQIIPRISPKATWYFTEFESRDRENLRIKKIKLRRYGFKGNFGVYPG